MSATLRNFGTLQRTLFLRQAACSIEKPYTKRFLSENLKKKYEQYQRDDGVPVFLKGGFGDRVLYLTTVALCVIGVGNGLYTLLSMAFKKK